MLTLYRSKLIGTLAAATLSVSFLVSPACQAASKFDHTLRIIVPFASGGTSDILARIIAPRLSAALGQNVIVENKPGDAGNVGAETVAKAPRDGHTLLLMDVGSLVTAPSLFNPLPYNVDKDLAPIGMIMFAPYVLAVHPSVPAKTAPELIRYSLAHPGKLSVANSGLGAINHITALIIAKEFKLSWINVPYKGGAAASRAVVSGESQIILNGTTATLPYVAQEQLVGLAVTGKNRLKNLPNVRTFRESGLPAQDAGSFQGLLTTGGTPPATIQRLNDELRKILAQPEVRQIIAEQGGEVRNGPPEELKAWLKTNIATYGEIIRTANIRLDASK